MKIRKLNVGKINLCERVLRTQRRDSMFSFAHTFTYKTMKQLMQHAFRFPLGVRGRSSFLAAVLKSNPSPVYRRYHLVSRFTTPLLDML